MTALDSFGLRSPKLAIINAPFEQGGWNRALDELTHACRGSGANLVALGGPFQLSLNLFAGDNGNQIASAFARPELWGPCNWRVQSGGRVGHIVHEASYAASWRRPETEIYDDVVADLDINFGCQTALLADSRSFLGLALFRNRRQGPCDEQALTAFGNLVRDMRRSLRAQLALAGEAADLMIGDLSEVSGAVLLVDRHGNVSGFTEAAEHLAENGGPLSFCGMGFRLRNRDENRVLELGMRRLLQLGDALTGTRVFTMPAGRSAQHPLPRWTVDVVRLPRLDHGLGFEPALAVAFHPLTQSSGPLDGATILVA